VWNQIYMMNFHKYWSTFVSLLLLESILFSNILCYSYHDGNCYEYWSVSKRNKFKVMHFYEGGDRRVTSGNQRLLITAEIRYFLSKKMKILVEIRNALIVYCLFYSLFYYLDLCIKTSIKNENKKTTLLNHLVTQNIKRKTKKMLFHHCSWVVVYSNNTIKDFVRITFHENKGSWFTNGRIKRLPHFWRQSFFFICFSDIAIDSYDEKKKPIISVEILINLLLKGIVVSDYNDFRVFLRK